jgi:Holliday junction resolvase
MIKINTEEDLHSLLKEKGFYTNHKKKESANGCDIVAIKDGELFNVEHKRLQLRDTGVYRYGGEILGDILICSTPFGNPIFIVNEKTSLTKTARFIDALFGDGNGNGY